MVILSSISVAVRMIEAKQSDTRNTDTETIHDISRANMYHEHVIKKIPGIVQPLSKREGQGFIEDLSSKEIFELEEILQRQNKLLQNKKFVSRLPDKGAKIIEFRDRVAKEIALKNDVERAANLLSRLNVAAEGKAAMNELEWTGKYTENGNVRKVVELASDDEEDPLKILAQPTGSGTHRKKIIHLPAEESLIKPEDLRDVETKVEDGSSEEQHVRYIVDKVEKPLDKSSHKAMERFKPYKTTKSNVHDPAKELNRKRDEHWEVTAATPPPSIHGDVKMLGIQESLALQRHQAETLQEIQTQHATERLMAQLSLRSNDTLPKIAGTYRSVPDENSSSSSSDAEDEEQEMHDEEDADKAGTVVFTVEQ